MIQSKFEMREWLDYEASKYGNIGIKSVFFPITERDYIWKFQWILRHTEYHTNCGHRVRSVFLKIWHSKMSVKYGIHIPINTCGKGLKIMHIGPILINWKAHIGNDVSLHINTAIVAQGYSSEVPSLGDNIVVGVGAVLLGNIEIADNIVIGANSVVNKSFLEENIAIAGVPARKISENGRLAWQQAKNKQ